jgi:hypothetical protein
MTEPYEAVQQVERAPQLPPGPDERAHGYGVMACPFASGDILCHRRFVASSFGPPYTSIWHRDPAGEWHFYQDTSAEQSCARYFGSALTSATETRISSVWTDARTLQLSTPNIDWTLSLAATPVTRALNGIGSVMPESLWRSERVLGLMSRIAGRALGAGRMQLAGTTPNRQYFVANPLRIWVLTKASATIGGRSLGTLAVSHEQTALGDFWIPRRGLFAVGQSYFEPFDPKRHLSADPQPSPGA